MIDCQNLIDKRYKKIQSLGEGGYGRVSKCLLIDINSDKNKGTQEEKFYAVKKYFLHKIVKYINNFESYTDKFVEDQFNFMASLSHPNIIKPIEYFVWKSNHYIVYDYCNLDLANVIQNNKLQVWEIKHFAKEIFKALKYLHENNIIHRDIKPDNIIVHKNGEKYEKTILCDFDLAKKFEDKNEKKMKNVCTLYYKPPEILMGSQIYDETIDIWGAGCIIAEMILQKPLFDSRTEIGVLGKIIELLGSPNENNWPGYSDIPNYMEFSEQGGIGIRKVFASNYCEVPEEITELLEKIFLYDSNKRISAERALEHRCFD